MTKTRSRKSANFPLQRTAGGGFRSGVSLHLFPLFAPVAPVSRQSLSFSFGDHAKARMKSTSSEDLRGIWAIAWRSLAFLPWMIGVLLLVVGVMLGLAALPMMAAIELYFGLWRDASWKIGVWLMLLWVARRKSIRRYQVWPPSVL